MNLIQRLREQKEIKNLNSQDRVREEEESLEEIGEGDDDN
jgi:hypothetical protein